MGILICQADVMVVLCTTGTSLMRTQTLTAVGKCSERLLSVMDWMVLTMAEFVLTGQELFGRYARIAYGHALDGKQDYHIYKCIRSFMSNCYCDVPLTYQTENNCHTHDNIVEVVNVIHCGIDENRVIRVARNDIELLPAPDVEPAKHGRWDGDTCTSCNLPWNYNMTQNAQDWGYFDPMPDYCPNCGAKMDEEVEHAQK